MRVVSTFHRPSTVLASFHCRLSNVEISHLVVAKTNQIEVHAWTGDGVEWRTSLEVWGYIVDAKPVSKPVSFILFCFVLLKRARLEMVNLLLF